LVRGMLLELETTLRTSRSSTAPLTTTPINDRPASAARSGR
jgi:hypothetical protein